MEKLTIAEVAEFAGMKQAQAKHQMKIFLCERVLKAKRLYTEAEIRGMLQFSGVDFQQRMNYAKGIHQSQRRIEHVYNHKPSIRSKTWTGGIKVYKKWNLLPEEVLSRIEKGWEDKHESLFGNRQTSILDFAS